jgi:hypothetical protein
MALSNCLRCGRSWQANSGVEPCPFCRAEQAEAERDAANKEAERLRMNGAEEVQELCDDILSFVKAVGIEPDYCNSPTELFAPVGDLLDALRVDVERKTKALEYLVEYSCPPAPNGMVTVQCSVCRHELQHADDCPVVKARAALAAESKPMAGEDK